MELYYYTTVETMKFIISKGNIYATNVGYLNDSDEYINGLREIRNLLKQAEEFRQKTLAQYANRLISDEIYNRIKAEASDIYSISFSRAHDLLSQWHMYARESGVQIKMQFEETGEYLYFRDENAMETKQLETKPVYYLTQIGMPQNEYKKSGESVLREFEGYLRKNGNGDEEGEFISTWKMLAPYIKNYGFRQEEEVRTIFLANEEAIPVKYRSNNGVLKPYLDIEMKNGWPVCNIMVGPGRNQNRVFQSICHFLEHAELKIDRVKDQKLVEDYFEGMKEYPLPTVKIEACKEQVLSVDSMLTNMGVKYSEKIRETLNTYEFSATEREVVNDYVKNNYFCDKGIIVNKSKWPYEF